MAHGDALPAAAPVSALARGATGRFGAFKAVSPALAAVIVFQAWLVYYGWCLFPGLGGELNAGDSAKIQVLGHTSIMLHGPGYPLVLMLAAAVRALALPLPEWWTITFAVSAVPAALANTVAFLIVHRLTRNTLAGLAAAVLLGSSSLLVVQATEAEVYALALAFVLTTVFLLILFVETKRPGFFLAACAVYAFSFGNHLMMVMLLPLFLVLTALNHRTLLRPKPIAMVALFVLLGASQYLYLAYVAYSPETSYSEYMPLPPEPTNLISYVFGTYFGTLYGSGLTSTGTLEALINTLRFAHPWLSLPLIAVSGLLFLAGWKVRDAKWYGLAVAYGAALSFVPFVLWYGAYDIRAFHLPVLGPLIVAAVATPGWSLRRRPIVVTAISAALLTIGLARATQAAILLGEREPIFAGLKPAIRELVAQSPVERPVIAMSYGLRMATLYYELRGELPQSPIYRVRWRAIAAFEGRPSVGGIVVPTDGYQFMRWIEERRPDLTCRTKKLKLPETVKWPAYAFECSRESSAGR